MSFLAVLGWLTAGLLAWGNAAGSETRMIPWKWFALFCIFASIDAGLDLARMAVPEIWPPELGSVFRLAAYGCLMEFARRGASRAGWVQLPRVLPFAIIVAIQILVFFTPDHTGPEIVAAFLGGVSAAVVIIGTVTRRSRLLLVTAATLLLLGPLEILRSATTVTIGGLFGLLVTGEGFATALTASVLAWVAGAALWMYGILRRRTGLFAGRPESFSPLAAIVLPVSLVATLTIGYYLVNESSRRARQVIDNNYLNLARTAALAAIDADTFHSVISSDESGLNQRAVARIRRQLDALRAGNEAFLRTYLWVVANGQVLVPNEWTARSPDDTGRPAIHLTPPSALTATGEADLRFDLLSNREEARVILANAPVYETVTGAQLAWLAIDILPRDWLAAQAGARLQTMALVGLFASLLVFFIAHAMLREHQAELLVGKESAEAADRAKDEFLAVMSHELRTPMQSVLGYGDLLGRTSLGPAQAGYVDAIRSQGRTLLRVVQDILDFSTLRKSSYALKQETVYLHRLIETSFESIQPLAAKRNLRFEHTIARNVPEVVVGDAVRIEQILLNLMGNAVKFTDDGSIRLDVTLEKVEERARTTIHWVRFSVRDTGLGIRESEQERLFKPFTRLTYADHTRREGTGLGLAIVKRLCDLMGGRIELESTWGKGSHFRVHLPLSATSGPAVDPTVGAAAGRDYDDKQLVDLGALLPLRVLVAEDNPFIRRLMVEYLKMIGYTAKAVVNGQEALEQWHDHDLIVLDLRMPVLDGIAAAKGIRAQSGQADRPWIIGVSATLSEAEVTRAMESGMNDFLGKPFLAQSFVEAIEASPLYASRVRNRSAGEDAKPRDDTTEEVSAPGGGMSWMPDFTAEGDAEIVAQALAEIPLVMEEIDAALQKEDLATTADRAHYLKNTIFALRIEVMRGPCLAVDARANAGNLTAARQAMEELHAAFTQWKAESTPGPGAESAEG